MKNEKKKDVKPFNVELEQKMMKESNKTMAEKLNEIKGLVEEIRAVLD